MKIVCAQSVLGAAEIFSYLGEVTILADGQITAHDLIDVQALIVRSKTAVNAGLLQGTAVNFVGTATSGIDHLDQHFLNQANISWAAAVGANANSVAEYVVAALLYLATQHGFSLRGQTLGVIGLGCVGQALAAKARGLGLTVLANDPPRQRLTGDHVLVSLAELLQQSDIISLHVPLTREGEDATYHLADDHFFSSLKPNAIFINTSRGEVVQTSALMKSRVKFALLDVWEGEPDFNPDLVQRASLVTPHIAGYSLDGRIEGSLMIYRALCQSLGVEPKWTLESLYPDADQSLRVINAAGVSDESLLWNIVKGAYNVADSAGVLAPSHALTTAQRQAYFQALRQGYPSRWEFKHHPVRVLGVDEEMLEKIGVLGFEVHGERKSDV